MGESCEYLSFRASDADWPTIQPLQLPSGTSVEGTLMTDATLKLVVQAPDATRFSADVSVPREARVAGCGGERTLTSARAVPLVALHGDVSIQLSPAPPEPLFNIPVPITAVAFWHREEPRPDTYQEVSDLVDASIYYGAIDTTRALHEAQLLKIGVKEGNLELVTVADNLLTVRFRGNVNRLDLYTGTSSTSLVPSYLEMLSKRRSALLIYTGITWLFGAVMSIVKWARSLP
jgi:hypothetical protein